MILQWLNIRRRLLIYGTIVTPRGGVIGWYSYDDYSLGIIHIANTTKLIINYLWINSKCYKRVHVVLQLQSFRIQNISDDDLIGKVVNAIMASAQPKECSVRSLKNYVTEFYSDFKVLDRPFLFKHAIERAERNEMIRWGGASGLIYIDSTSNSHTLIYTCYVSHEAT